MAFIYRYPSRNKSLSGSMQYHKAKVNQYSYKANNDAMPTTYLPSLIQSARPGNGRYYLSMYLLISVLPFYFFLRRRKGTGTGNKHIRPLSSPIITAPTYVHATQIMPAFPKSSINSNRLISSPFLTVPLQQRTDEQCVWLHTGGGGIGAEYAVLDNADIKRQGS